MNNLSKSKIKEDTSTEDKNHCIFEKRKCEYANKNGNVFKCEAPNDDSMTCR